jgi:hypothetical protein
MSALHLARTQPETTLATGPTLSDVYITQDYYTENGTRHVEVTCKPWVQSFTIPIWFEVPVKKRRTGK